MKKWYSKLKENENYNVIILAVLVALVIELIRSCFVTAANVSRILIWDVTNVMDFLMGAGTIINVICIVLAIAFVIQACKRDPKFIICAIVAMSVVAVTGPSLCAVQCIIACGYWLWMIKKPSGKTEFAHICRLTIIMIGFSMAAFLTWEVSSWISFGFDTLKYEVLYAVPWAMENCFNPEIFLVAYLYKHSHRRIFKMVCIMLAVVWVVLAIGCLVSTVIGLANFSEWSEWGPEEMPSNVDSLEAGDWSQWETEDDLSDTFQMEAVNANE